MNQPGRPPLTLDRVQRGELYTPSEVATLFKVDRHTVAAWCRKGYLQAGKTPGGGYYRILGIEVLRAWGAMFQATACSPTPTAQEQRQEIDTVMDRIRNAKKSRTTKNR